MRNQVRFQTRCPRCQQGPGQACRNKQGELLDGSHLERTRTARREIRAAIEFYAGMGLKTRDRRPL